MTDTMNDRCAELEERMTELLDGTAPEALYDHLSECDRCRDARHEAEQAAALISESGADYRLPADLEARMLGALDARGDAPAAEEPAASGRVAGDEPSSAAEGGAAERAPATERSPAKSTSDEPERAEPERAEPTRASTRASATPDEPAAGSRRTDNQPPARAPSRMRRVWLGVAATGLAAAAAVALISRHDPSPKDDHQASAWRGTVESVTTASGATGGLELCDASGAHCAPLGAGGEVPAGKLVKTDSRTRAILTLDDDTRLTLDRATHLALDTETGRNARLEAGALVADVTHLEGQTARITFPSGFVRVLGTKFALTLDDGAASVDVSRGVVELGDQQGRKVEVRAGEEGRLIAGAAPWAENAPGLGEALAWSEPIQPKTDEPIEVRGLGQLVAKKPGQTAELDGAVVLASHSVKVRIAGSVARTEVDETFTNTTGDVLEGIYRFPLPPDAKIERLALEVDGKLEEGAFVDRDRGAAIMRGALVQATPQLRRQMRDEIVWVPGPWRDPALLEWQRGGRFELTIYPIPKRGSRRVVLAYTQVVPQSAGVRRYVYPLAYDPGGSTTVDRFDVDVEVRGQDPSFGVRSRGYALNQDREGDAESLKLSERNFSPSGDLVLEYALPDRASELTAWAYQPEPASDDATRSATRPASAKHESLGDDAYVALALRPKLPRATDDARRAFAVVVDASRSMYGERFKRAASLAARVLGELDPSDQVTLLACDVSCQALPGGLRAPGPRAMAEAERFLEGIAPEGASDLAGAIKSARAAMGSTGGRATRIVYIGDGTPTVGPIRASYLTRAVEDAVPAGKGAVTAVAIGADADLDSLEAVARGGGGVVLPYVPGQSVAEAAYAVLGATYGAALRDVTVELPAGLTRVAPSAVDTIPAGGERFVVARMSGASVEGTVVVRGMVADQPFEQRYPLSLTASRAQGNAFVPRVYAAVRIAELETRGGDDAKKEAIALSSALSVQSRYTSLLVLESQAMFRAFGLDNSRSAPTWTGEEEADATTAEGALAVADGESKSEADGKLDDAAGFGLGGAPAPKQAAATGAAAPAPARAARRPAPSGGGPSFAAEAYDDSASWPPPRPNMVPMRRVWTRTGSVLEGERTPKTASASALSDAERDAERNPDNRGAMKKLYTLYALSGELERASETAERWSGRDPLDPGALTARADLAARRGNRDEAMRILGSVVDVRPGDVASQRRLARALRWAGRPEEGCRYLLALAQLNTKDASALADSVRCGRATGERSMADDMLSSADAATRAAAQRLLDRPDPFTDSLSGDLRLEASWSGGADVDLALLTPEGDRVSWLGAPTRAVITATDVDSTRREGLALRGAKPGDYVIEITRGGGGGPTRGEVVVTVAGTKRSIPFRLDGDGQTLGIARVAMTSHLEPVRGWVR